MNHLYKGYKIFGSELIVHVDKNGNAKGMNGNYQIIKNDIDVSPIISVEKAIDTVRKDLEKKFVTFSLTNEQKTFLKVQEIEIDTVLYETNLLLNTHVLAYKISIRPNIQSWYDYFINAKNGKILNSYSKICHADGPKTVTGLDLNNVNRTVNAAEKSSITYLADISQQMYNSASETGIIYTYDSKNTFGNNFRPSLITFLGSLLNNPTAVSAHKNAEIAYNYFKNTHNRNSINGIGGDIFSLVNVVDNSPKKEDGSNNPNYGQSWENATWNGTFISYGNGGANTKPFAGSLDVAGHEMSHGVVQFTAGLIYQGESGALNESFSDIFGCMMDSTDWTIGEDIVKPNAFQSGALRSLSDPYNGGLFQNYATNWQPKKYSEKYNGLEDYGGVHINSGIPNHAFYLFATAINSRYRASKVFYKALTENLTSNSQFIDLRIGVIQAAEDLYGVNSNEVIQAKIAFNTVEIFDEEPENYTITLASNPGIEYLLSYDTNVNDVNGIYRSSPTGTSFAVMTPTKNAKSRPSVSDNGNTTVFVGKDNKLYAFNSNPSNLPNLTILENNPIWHSVAISKDGTKLALTLEVKDSSIYVLDMNTNSLKRFKLYNPTFTEGVKANGPIYADALDWSHNGDYVLYDCYNKIKYSNGDSLTNWDINYIKVWDFTTNTFAGGNIIKLFNNLAPTVNIGNPVFSKTNPHLIAFDYYESTSNTFGVFGMNILFNKYSLISYNKTLGTPSFNSTDIRVAFTDLDNSNNKVINYVTLNSDKISSNGIKTQIITKAEFPVYYSVGNRLFPTLSIITQPISQTICGSNFVNLEVSVSGTGLNDYRWNTGQVGRKIIAKKPGIYQVTVTGMFGVAISNLATITTFLGTNIITQPISKTICGNNLANLSVSATGSNLSYLWSNGETTANISTSQVGNYSVTVSGCGYVISDIATLQSKFNTFITTQPISQTICGTNLANLSVSATGSILSYLWSNGATNPNISTSQVGNYTVTVSGSCGNVVSNLINVSTCLSAPSTGISQSENVDKNSFTIIPNPTNGEFRIETNIQALGQMIEIYSIQGKQIYKSVLKDVVTKLDFILPNGVYLVKLGNQTQKMIVLQ